MIKIEIVDIFGWEAAIRGMRNPYASWEKSDSFVCEHGITPECSCCEDRHTGRCADGYIMGDNDLKLMKQLSKAGTSDAKFRRMITVYCDITAPLYWWKEFDTYKVGTVANSCSTMHSIADKEFRMEDFSCEHIKKLPGHIDKYDSSFNYPSVITCVITALNEARKMYIETKDKDYWWQLIQLLPSSYNQKRTVMLNYEVLANIYKSRRNHKLDEWRDFCSWIETLPYSEVITGERD